MGAENLAATGISIFGPSSALLVSVPTELSWRTFRMWRSLQEFVELHEFYENQQLTRYFSFGPRLN
jgi:hypothetical protein